MTVQTATITTTPVRAFFQRIRTFLGGVAATMADASHAARCGQEAQWLLDMSDAELARRGLKRDQVVQLRVQIVPATSERTRPPRLSGRGRSRTPPRPLLRCGGIGSDSAEAGQVTEDGADGAIAVARSRNGPLRVGIGGPVGAGKTALMDQLCKRMRARWSIAAITNDIYTREDAEFLMRSQALPLERIVGVETGGCPHTAIREDASINLAAVDDLVRRFPDLDLILIEFGRRQPLGDLLPRARRPHALRHRRLRRRQDPAQGRPRRDPLRPPRHQQDRPRPACRRLARGHGPRCAPHARQAPVPVRPGPRRRRRAGNRRLRRDRRRPRRLIREQATSKVYEDPRHMEPVWNPYGIHIATKSVRLDPLTPNHSAGKGMRPGRLSPRSLPRAHASARRIAGSSLRSSRRRRWRSAA